MNHPHRRRTDPTPHPQSPKGLFSRDLEQTARMQAWDDTWSHRKSMVMAFYLIDIGGALVRSLLHVLLWVPSIVLWPLLLSSNGVVQQNVVDWLISVGGGGWSGALWKLVGAVFVLSLTTQFLQGGVGERLRRHLDRSMERSLLWSMIQGQIPLLSPQKTDTSSDSSTQTPRP